MRKFIITQSEPDLTSHAGLALIGQALHRGTDLPAALDENIALRHGIAHSDVVLSYIALLSLGKSDFEAIHDRRIERFFAEALGLREVPSEPTLRQRLDQRATEFLPYVRDAAVEFLARAEVELTPVETGHVPLDADVTPFDNSNTRKEGVSRTYEGHDGYAPMAAYLGREGYCLELELRRGSQHCQKGTPAVRLVGTSRLLESEPTKGATRGSMRYSEERKEAVLKKLLPPHNRTVASLAEEEGVSTATLYNWRKAARGKGRLLPD